MTTALITGGSSGMGLEYARQLAKEGCLLILVSNQYDYYGSMVRPFDRYPVPPILCKPEERRFSGVVSDTHG